MNATRSPQKRRAYRQGGIIGTIHQSRVVQGQKRRGRAPVPVDFEQHLHWALQVLNVQPAQLIQRPELVVGSFGGLVVSTVSVVMVIRPTNIELG